MTIDELRAEMLNGFSEIRAEIKAGGETTRRRFDEVHAQINEVHARINEVHARINTEGETMRRHFDMMAERMADSVKIVAEATAHHTTRIENHEKRLERLERPR